MRASTRKGTSTGDCKSDRQANPTPTRPKKRLGRPLSVCLSGADPRRKDAAFVSEIGMTDASPLGTPRAEGVRHVGVMRTIRRPTPSRADSSHMKPCGRWNSFGPRDSLRRLTAADGHDEEGPSAHPRLDEMATVEGSKLESGRQSKAIQCSITCFRSHPPSFITQGTSFQPLS